MQLHAQNKTFYCSEPGSLTKNRMAGKAEKMFICVVGSYTQGENCFKRTCIKKVYTIVGSFWKVPEKSHNITPCSFVPTPRPCVQLWIPRNFGSWEIWELYFINFPWYLHLALILLRLWLSADTVHQELIFIYREKNLYITACTNILFLKYSFIKTKHSHLGNWVLAAKCIL